MVGCFTLLYSRSKLFDNFYTKLPTPENGSIVSIFVGWCEHFITFIAVYICIRWFY